MHVTESPLAGDTPVSNAKSDLRSDRQGDRPTAFPLGPAFPLKVRPSWLLLLCLATLAAALAIDLTLAAESAVGVLYVVALLLASWLPSRRVTLGLALVATVFLAFGYLHEPLSQGVAPTAAVLNRAFFVLLLWLAAALAISHQASRLALGRIQDDLSAKEARLLSILDTAPEAIVTIDERGTIESFSRSATALFGYTAEEMVGRNVRSLMPPPYNDEHTDYVERYRRTGERRVIGIGRVVEGRRKDGSTFPAELAVGEALIDDRRIFTGFLRDLTMRQRIEQDLRQSQKMEAIGQLTGGIAHDFNNLLTVILGDMEMLQDRVRDPQHLEILKEARETAEHGAELTGRLLAFARRQALNPKLVDVGDLVAQFTGLLRRALGETIEISVSAMGRLTTNVDPSQLQNAILNLALNARDAMPNGGDLAIDVSEIDLDADYVRTRPDVQPGRYVLISMTDNGVGMSREVRERAFEPFFTTKPVGAGTGLGLSMIYGFAKQSGGHADIYSEPNFGTTVRLYLPLSGEAEEADQNGERKLGSLLAARGELVLVVEDDARVRRVTVSRLEQLGYRILEAENGPQAVNVLARHPDVDLLFTDIIMPGGMTGTDLAREVRTRNPNMKVLFTSGYAEPQVLRQGRVHDDEWIKKPYTAANLARKLRDVLDQKAEQQL
jgi:PAS domain S-box-containing protein